MGELHKQEGTNAGCWCTWWYLSHLQAFQLSRNRKERFIALYILQGLNPSPQVEMKFNSQETDPVQGNDLCYHVFGCDAVRRHKQFKAFFCVQDPMKVAPPRKEQPTYKIDPFLIHVQE